MTMRNPNHLIDAERNLPIAETFDPAKRYRYTWPGQAPKIVTGKELTELTRGADVSKLEISEASEVAFPKSEARAERESK